MHAVGINIYYIMNFTKSTISRQKFWNFVIIYYIKLKSCLSDRPTDISAVSPWNDVRLARNESWVFWNHVVYKSSSAIICPHKCVKGTSVS